MESSKKSQKSEALNVYIRVRPPISKEVKHEYAVFVQGNSAVKVKSEKTEITCEYDHIFNEVQEQEDVFQKVKPLLQDVMRGINACIFAYGQTSAGKTHTMLGPNGGQDLFSNRDRWGVLPRAAESIFTELEEKANKGLISYQVTASFLQIYNENLYDLLRDNPSRYIDNDDEQSLSSLDDGLHRERESGLKIREVPRVGGQVRQSSSTISILTP